MVRAESTSVVLFVHTVCGVNCVAGFPICIDFVLGSVNCRQPVLWLLFSQVSVFELVVIESPVLLKLKKVGKMWIDK